MMMSCPMQPPANLFCSPAAAAASVGCTDLLDIGVPQPLLAAAATASATANAAPHPLFPAPASKQQQAMAAAAAASTTTMTNGSGGCQLQLQQHHDNNQQLQTMTATPGAWFFQQSPIMMDSGADGCAVLGGVAGLDNTSTTASALCSAAAMLSAPLQSLPSALSPPPGSLAHQQLLARFGPRHSTESVEVPSSEHVAEIVGRQGCKIKALRAKTNTYIKTPVRGEEPVFVVTGRHEDVLEAKREIECAAEHFTQIRASRRHSQGGCPAPGHVTAYVRVPLRVVGLVVGPKGNTIKRIQQDTHTYIITPSREREPIFEVTGLPQNVEAARREIEQHIYQRTGNMPITDSSASIANFDLHSAAMQAQHAALHANATNRPNYGALAVTSTTTTTTPGARHHQQQQQQHQAVLMPSNGAAAQHQQYHHQQNHNGNIALSLGDLNGCFRSQQQQHHQQSQHEFFVTPLQHNHQQQQHHHDNMHITGGTGTTTKLYSSACCASPPPSFGPIGGGGSTGAVAPAQAIGGCVAGTASTTGAAMALQQQQQLSTSMSSSNLQAMLGALELDGGGGPSSQQQHQHQGLFSSAAAVNEFKLGTTSSSSTASSLLLLRSSSNGCYGEGGGGAAGALIQPPYHAAINNNNHAPSAFSPWRMMMPPSGGAVDSVDIMPNNNDFLDILSSTSPSPLFSASSGGGGGGSGSGGCHSSTYSVGSCAFGGAGFVVGGGGSGVGVCGGGLSSVNSTSRDEGLGDSPTNSFGRPNGPDPYQHLMTIWADVCDPSSSSSSTGLTPSNGGGGGGDECGKPEAAGAANDKSGGPGALNNIGG